MSEPLIPKVVAGRWQTWWYDSAKKQRWKSFGNAKKVSRAEAMKKYRDWLIKDFYANESVSDPSGSMTVTALVARYLKHADTYYRRPDGTPTGEATNLRHATQHLLAAYPDRQAHAIGIHELKQVRQKMVAAKMSRRVINQRINKTRAMYRWAAEEGILPDGEWMKQPFLKPLKMGRSDAVEGEPVKPVPQAHIDATLGEVHEPIATMIRLQMLTGMRVTETCIMRGQDIDRMAEVWWYTPQWHKSAHRGRERAIALGPQAQVLIAPHDGFGYLFVPTHHAAKQPRYNSNSYLRAIYRACDRLELPRWSPGQLRHNYAESVRRRFGLDAVAATLGHADIETSQIYATLDRDKAAMVAKEVG
jgi:integrase